MNKDRSLSTSGVGVLLLSLLAWWGWLPLLALIGWGLSNLLFSGMGQLHLFFNQFLNELWFHDTTLFYAYLVVGFIGTLIILGICVAEDELDDVVATVVGGVTVLALVYSFIGVWVRAWDDDKDVARYYNSANQFVVPDPHHSPSSLIKLLTGSNEAGTSGCDLSGPSGDDVHACIVKGSYVDNWQPRVSSLDGARTVIGRTSGNLSGVKLDPSSVEYLNSTHGGTAQWSGVIDGSGRFNSMWGVAEWDGRETTPTTCKFSSSYHADRAVHGSRGNNLKNMLNDRFPALQFHYDEYWGYCKDNKPVVVFPVTRQLAFQQRLVNAPAGVVVLTGGGDGFNYTYDRHAAPGEFPGPVYSASVVDKQVTAADWAGGRKLEQNNFGFRPSNSKAQETNNRDYLLESNVDHHLYWVTPLTPRYSSSQLTVAVAATRADQVSENKLNTTKIYVLSDNDKRIVNIDNIENVARQYILSKSPGFFSSGGNLLEFIPQDGTVYRAYGELTTASSDGSSTGGRVVFRIDVDGASQVVSSFVELNGTGADVPGAGLTGGTTTPPTTAPSPTPTVPVSVGNGEGCNAPDKLTPTQIRACIDNELDALAHKSGK